MAYDNARAMLRHLVRHVKEGEELLLLHQLGDLLPLLRCGVHTCSTRLRCQGPDSTVTLAELRVMHTASTQPAAAGVLKHTSCLPAALPRQGNKRQREGEGDDKTPVGLCAQACRSTTSPGEPLLRSSSSPSWSRPRVSGL